MRFAFRKCGILWLIMVFTAAIVMAQPGPSEEQKNELFRQDTVKKLKEINSKIRLSRKNAELNHERGVLYLELFLRFGTTVKYEEGEFETDIDNKSIKDLDLAIKLKPQARFFLDRGRFYAKRWADDAGDLGFSQILKWWNEDRPPVSWQIVEAKFLNNPYFIAAEKDFSEAVNLASFHQPKDNYDFSERTLYSENYLIRLYYDRAYTLMNNSSLSKTIASENKAYVVLEDWDKYINYYKERVGTKYEMVNDKTLLDLGYELKKIAICRLKNRRNAGCATPGSFSEIAGRMHPGRSLRTRVADESIERR